MGAVSLQFPRLDLTGARPERSPKTVLGLADTNRRTGAAETAASRGPQQRSLTRHIRLQRGLSLAPHAIRRSGSSWPAGSTPCKSCGLTGPWPAVPSSCARLSAWQLSDTAASGRRAHRGCSCRRCCISILRVGFGLARLASYRSRARRLTSPFYPQSTTVILTWPACTAPHSLGDH